MILAKLLSAAARLLLDMESDGGGAEAAAGDAAGLSAPLATEV